MLVPHLKAEATLQFGQSLGAVDGEVFGRPVSVEVIEPLAEPLELRWDIAEVTEQQRASIVPLRWDEDLEVWAVDEGDATDLSVDGDELVLVTSEFSWRSWSWAADFGQLGPVARLTEHEPVAEEEPAEALAGPTSLLHRIHADPAQITDRLLTFGRDADRGQLPGP